MEEDREETTRQLGPILDAPGESSPSSSRTVSTEGCQFGTYSSRRTSGRKGAAAVPRQRTGAKRSPRVRDRRWRGAKSGLLDFRQPISGGVLPSMPRCFGPTLAFRRENVGGFISSNVQRNSSQNGEIHREYQELGLKRSRGATVTARQKKLPRASSHLQSVGECIRAGIRFDV